MRCSSGLWKEWDQRGGCAVPVPVKLCKSELLIRVTGSRLENVTYLAALNSKGLNWRTRMVVARWGSEGAATNHPLVGSGYLYHCALFLWCLVSRVCSGILSLGAVPDPETVTGLKPYLSWETPGSQLWSDKCYSNREETALCCRESFSVLTFSLLFKTCGVCLPGNSCSTLTESTVWVEFLLE